MFFIKSSAVSRKTTKMLRVSDEHRGRGITLIFLPHSTFIIPIAIARFAHQTATFHLVKTKRVKQIPVDLAHIISDSALITYGFIVSFADLEGLFY